MTRKCSTYIFIAFLLLGLFLINNVAIAQTSLDRISAVERSDGNGYVIRYHLSELVDSSKVIQAQPDLIQIMLYSEEMDTTGIQLPPANDVFHSYVLYKTPTGLGVDILLAPDVYFLTRTYPDQNGKDLLVALEYSTQEEIELRTEGIDPIDWAEISVKDSELSDNTIDYDDRLLGIRDHLDLKVIVLDAGHGGKDPGTVNRHLGLQEKDIVLSVTKKVGAYIEEHLPDVEVVYTRTDDRFLDVHQRGLIATRSKGDLFVSIHANAAHARSAYGAEVFFLGLARSESALEVMKRENSAFRVGDGPGPTEISEEELMIYELSNAVNISMSEYFAAKIEDQFRNRAQRRSRGVKQAGLMALWHASMPAVLIELGFLSNTKEGRFLASDYGQDILASAIFRAIRDLKVEFDHTANGINTASNER